MANYVVSDTSLTSVADAIRTKGGTSAALAYPAGFVSAISAIPTGGTAPVEPKDVNFYDYDGTITNSYTAQEFAALSAMPANPSHTGLTAQGWNWTLSDAKTYVTSYGKLNIGQMYTTVDGKTRIYIRLEGGRLSPTLGLCPNGSVDVDWGDGSAHSTVTGTSVLTLVNTQHIYAAAGDYVIALTVTGSCGIIGSSSYGSQLIWKLLFSFVCDDPWQRDESQRRSVLLLLFSFVRDDSRRCDKHWLQSVPKLRVSFVRDVSQQCDEYRRLCVRPLSFSFVRDDSKQCDEH